MADGSLSQFKATLARKIERNQKRQARSERNSSNSKGSGSKPDFDFPELSKTDLEKVKYDIREKAKSDRRKAQIRIAIVIIIFTLFTLLLSYLLLF